MPYGFSEEQWDQMFETGLIYLERLARDQGDCSYTDFCNELRATCGVAPEPHSDACSQLLRQIAEETFDSHGAIVTALVHYKDGGIEPGPGFFDLCHRLGLIEAKPYSDDRKLEIVTEQVRLVIEAYRRRKT
jgi:hypothetical protein